MKTRIIFLVLLIVCFACETNNKPVPDAEKEKMISEVKQVINDINKALEDVNFDAANEPCLDSPDFSYTSNGITKNYEEFMEFKTDFDKRINQEFTLISEKYAVLDKTTVLSTSKCKWLINYKDGHALLLDPWVVQATFKKINNKWRVLNLVECGVEQSVKNTETSNQLNPVELKNQFIGSWKYEYGKDTTGYADWTIYWSGLDAYGKLVSKGKTIMEQRITWAYDKTLDKIIGLNQIKGGNIALLSAQWISKNKYVLANYKNISNPVEASTRTEGTLKSHDLLEIVYYVNNKPVNTVTYTRVK